MSARCDRVSLTGPAPLTTLRSYVSREPPLPALLTGLPLAISTTRTGFYLSRLLTSLFGAALFATSVALAASRRRPALLVGVVVALTPAALAEFGVLGTSWLEVGSAALVWVAVTLLIAGEPMTWRFAALLAVASVLLIESRPISFGFAAVAGAVAVVGVGSRRLRVLLRSGPFRLVLAVDVVAMGVALAWFELATAPWNPFYLSYFHLPVVTDPGQRLQVAAGSESAIWSQLVGATGANDSPPGFLVILWTALACGVVVAGLLVASRRIVVLIVGLIATLLLLPIAAQAATLPHSYLYWQGRYSLPLFSGVMILAAAALDRRLPGPALRRLIWMTLPLVACLQVVEFLAVLRRYVVGTNGPLNPLHWTDGWRPPLPVLVLLPLGIVVLAAAYGLLLWLTRRPERPDETPPQPADDDKPPATAGSPPRWARAHSHSMVPGGLEVTS